MELTFSSCWKELGCCDLSMFLEGWEGAPENLGGIGWKRNDRGETRLDAVFKGRAAGSLERSMLVRKEPRGSGEVSGCPSG